MFGIVPLVIWSCTISTIEVIADKLFSLWVSEVSKQ